MFHVKHWKGNNMYIELDLKEKDVEAIEKAYDYVYCHYDLSTENPDDREAVTTLMHLAELVTRG